MSRLAIISAIAVIVFTVSPSSLPASTLITTFDRQIEGDYGACDLSGPVEFYLGLNEPWPSLITPIGSGLALWNDGDSGSYDITPLNEPLFNDLSSTLTNGVDDLIFLLQGMPSCSPLNGGQGNFESLFFQNGSDLTGFTLDFVRLDIANVSINTIDNDPHRLAWSANVTYGFWGQPVPEPASLSFMMLMWPLLLRSRASRH